LNNINNAPLQSCYISTKGEFLLNVDNLAELIPTIPMKFSKTTSNTTKPISGSVNSGIVRNLSYF